MNATALRRASTVDQLTAVLRERILEGELEPGRRLIERELVEAYEVARHTLRAALRQLEVEGLVRVEPNRGARVAMLSGDELTELFALRLALEREAAHLALERGDGRLPAAVHEAAQRLQRLALRRRSTWSEISRAHNAVHASWSAAGGAPRSRAPTRRSVPGSRAASASSSRCGPRSRSGADTSPSCAPSSATDPTSCASTCSRRCAPCGPAPEAGRAGRGGPLPYSGDSSFTGGMRHLPFSRTWGSLRAAEVEGSGHGLDDDAAGGGARVDDGQQRIDARLGAELGVDRELAVDDLVVAGVDTDAVDPVAGDLALARERIGGDDLLGRRVEGEDLDRTTKQVVPTDSFSCQGEIPSYGINCVGVYAGNYEVVNGQFSIDPKLCAEPRVDPLLTVVYASKNASGAVVQAMAGRSTSAARTAAPSPRATASGASPR